jgi:hypothetical protein
VPHHREYIGDSVYAAYDGFMLTLYTDNGMGPSNIVHLEPGLLERVVGFRDRAAEHLKMEAEAQETTDDDDDDGRGSGSGVVGG